MTSQKKTPGVYIVEKNAFPNSVVEVPTAVPAFLGYTEKAVRGNTPLTNVPTRITSLAEYEALFGGAPLVKFDLVEEVGKLTPSVVMSSQYLLYFGLRMFFDNGGGACLIVSVGGYSGTQKSKDDFAQAWEALRKEQEPTMIVVPDAVLLPQDDYIGVANKAISEAVALKDRIAILDVFDGDKPRTHDDADVISGTKGFRNVIENDNPSFAVAYYPWLHTDVTSAAEMSFINLSEAGAKKLHDVIAKAMKAAGQTSPDLIAEVDKIIQAPTSDEAAQKSHNVLVATRPDYKQVMGEMLNAINVIPPSAAMAGVYAGTDNSVGVFKAPANTGIMGALAPTVMISSEEQQDLNVPLDGKAINAIRIFMGRGVLVWGARTLDGNSQDWRYLNVRRTMIMLEQSIMCAAQAYVFAPNVAGTWVTVRTMIENFLNNQWKAGALVGATPDEAYEVAVGLGSTMTGNDILDGYMRVTVKVAVTRPAEFIVITFQQKMQTS